jgi:hypothetical protein
MAIRAGVCIKRHKSLRFRRPGRNLMTIARVAEWQTRQT